MLAFNPASVLLYVLVIVLAILATIWTVLEFNPAGIPASLKDPKVKQWCLWKPGPNPGDKIIVSAITLHRTGTSIDVHKLKKKKGDKGPRYTKDHRREWVNFDQVMASYEQNSDAYAGVVFILPSYKHISKKKKDVSLDGFTRFTMVDWDKYLNHDGSIKKPESATQVEQAIKIGFVVEYSSSKQGSHGYDLGKKIGSLCVDKNDAPDLEMYDNGRPVIFTGQLMQGSATKLTSHPEFVKKLEITLHRRHHIWKKNQRLNKTEKFWEDLPATATIEEINKKLRTALGMNALIQEECFQGIHEITGRGINALKKQLKEIREQRRAEEQEHDEEPKQETPKAKLEPLSDAELATILGSKAYINPLQFLMDASQLIHLGDKLPMTFLEILIIGALLGRPFQVIVQGPASTGKSDMVGKALQCIPPESYKILAGATGAYLKRFLSSDLGTLLIIYLKETGGIADDDSLAAQVVKMISTDDRGGIFGFCARADKDWQAEDLTLPENLSFIATNAGERVPHQNLTRMWALECDSSATHNNAVIQRASLGDTFELKQNRAEFERKIQAWHQGIIPRIAAFKDKAHIPFLSTLRTLFTAGGTPLARHVNKFRTLIEIITQIHAACAPGCRPTFIRDGVRYVVSLAADFAWACQVGWDLLFNVIAGVSAKDRELLNRLREIEEKQIKLVEQKQMNDIQGATPIEIAGEAVDIEYAKKRLRKLLAEGYVIPGRTAKDGRVFSYRLSTKTFVGRTWTPVLPAIEADITQFCESNQISLPPSVIDPLTLVGDRDVDGEAS